MSERGVRRSLWERSLPKLEARLVHVGIALAQTGEDPSRLEHALRELHTLKGEARLLGLEALAKEAHRLEETLEQPEGLARGAEQLRSLQEMLRASSPDVGTRTTSLTALLEEMAVHARELAVSLHKEVAVSVTVEDTAAIDEELLPDLRDAVLHLVRNAVDHGLEPPDARGPKARCGVIALSAACDGGWLVVRVEDDGAGIDWSAVRHIAVARGLLAHEAPADAARLQELLFHFGFTTRARASETSGRGIGLDVVRRRIERLGGSVSVQSAPGAGTRFTLAVPNAS